MMKTLPSLFISHGSPELPLQTGAVTKFLQDLGDQFKQPRAILVISAHWGSGIAQVTGTAQPSTIHDFYGFPPGLYDLRYPAPGDPQMAQEVVSLLQAHAIPAEVDPTRGLDHGAWTVLWWMYPDANIPVVQLSLQPHQDPAYHLAMGQALQSLRQTGVLIIGSGGATHNLGALSMDGGNPPDWVLQFDDWVTQTLREGSTEDLVNYRTKAPFARRNHPTEEHFLPLLVAVGAGGSPFRGTPIHQGFSYGVLSMAAFKFP